MIAQRLLLLVQSKYGEQALMYTISYCDVH